MLNIKNKETYKLAKELSKVTGLSMTVAVTEAVREKLESEKTKNYKKRNKVAEELLKIAKRFTNFNNTGEVS
jgi:antitoxin VapB